MMARALPSASPPGKMDFDCSTVHLNADFANKYYLKKSHLHERGIWRTVSAPGQELDPYAAHPGTASERPGDPPGHCRRRRLLIPPVLLQGRQLCIRKRTPGPLAAGAAEGSGGPHGRRQPEAYRQIRFRPEASRLVPYTEMPLPKAPSGKWCWGQNDMKDHLDILKMFLAANGYDDRNVRLRISRSSYR